MRILNLFTIGLCLLWGTAVPAQGLLNTLTASTTPSEGVVRVDAVTAQLLAAQTAVAPGRPARLGLLLTHDPHWHTYWENPGDSGLPTRIEWSTASGQALNASEIRWPTPDWLPVGPLASFGYEGSALLSQTVDIPADAVPGQTLELIARAQWLACRDVCIPGEATLLIRLPVESPTAPLLASSQWATFEAAEQRLPRPDSSGQGYAVTSSHLVVWGLGSAQALEGFLFPRIEGLIVPAAAQVVSATANGWRLDIPLADSAKRVLTDRGASAPLEVVWRPTGQAQGQLWALTQGLAPQATEQIRTNTPVSMGGKNNSLHLALAIGLAFVGGLILNLMPCVFPVLGLKVLALGQSASSPAAARVHAAWFALGVVLSMLALAGLLLLLRAAGESIGWGFQLQNPWVVSLLGLLFVGIGLNLAGLFEVGTGLTRLGSLDRQEGPIGAFASGTLAVVVASPCTAPFMGSALGFAVTATTWEALLVFGMLGAGLATPYVLLAVIPPARALLPKPGAWMETFRQSLAFPMFATAAWLGWVLSQQNGPTASFALTLSMVCLAVAGWLWGRRQRRGQFTGPDRVVLLLALLATAGLLATSVQSSQSGVGPSADSRPSQARSSAANNPSWQAWAPGLPERLQSEGQAVFVDFTAAWCISCQANKARVLSTDPVASRLALPGMSALVADWTRQDPNITKELQRHGRSGVPMYLVYPKGGGQPILLGEWLTDEAVMAALDRAGAPVAPGLVR